MERPDGIVDFAPDPALYPFESRWFTSSVGPIHYIDEGQGRPLLLFHDNPDWSFLYSKIVSALRPDFRCVVPDYPGFGLSVHPDGYGYTAAEHAKIIGELVEHLTLTDMVVMGQDWGGPIAWTWPHDTPTGCMGWSWATPGSGPQPAARVCTFAKEVSSSSELSTGPMPAMKARFNAPPHHRLCCRCQTTSRCSEWRSM